LLEEDAATVAASGEAQKKSILEGFRGLLKKADVGIVDLRVKRMGPTISAEVFTLLSKTQSKSDDAWLPLEKSPGTQMLFHMALSILQVLQNGGVSSGR